MEPSEVQRVLRERAQIRVGPSTAEYAAVQIKEKRAQHGFFVMGGDARTGRPVRQKITSSIFQSPERK